MADCTRCTCLECVSFARAICMSPSSILKWLIKAQGNTCQYSALFCFQQRLCSATCALLLHVAACCYVLLRISGWTKSKIISHQSAPSVASRPLGSPFPGLASPIHPPTSPWTKAVGMGMRAVANAHRLNQFPHRIRILHLLHKGRSFKKFLKEGTGFVSHSARGAALGHYP